MLATATKSTERLQEFTASTGQPLRVDRDKGIIYGVKVLGHKSSNGRTYLPEAVSSAAKLYEGAKVNVNHVRGSTGPRDYQDRIGVIRGVRSEHDGLRGDLHYNPKHVLAEQLAWDAEHAPENVGLSHNVEGRTSRKSGHTLVEEIVHVHSVDLVADPATNKGLFESENRTMKLTIAKIIESAKAATAWNHAGLVKLREDGMMPADMPVDVGTADASADDQVKAAFRSMVIAAFDDDSLDAKATVNKIKQILAAQEKLTAKPDSGKKPEGDSTPASEGATHKPDPTLAGLQEELKRLRAESDVRALVDAAKVTATPVQVKAATLLEGDERKAFIESLPKATAGATSGNVQKPRSSQPITEGKDGKSSDAPAVPAFSKREDAIAFLRK